MERPANVLRYTADLHRPSDAILYSFRQIETDQTDQSASKMCRDTRCRRVYPMLY